jgi:hypothetical protein
VTNQKAIKQQTVTELIGNIAVPYLVTFGILHNLMSAVDMI